MNTQKYLCIGISFQSPTRYFSGRGRCYFAQKPDANYISEERFKEIIEVLDTSTDERFWLGNLGLPKKLTEVELAVDTSCDRGSHFCEARGENISSADAFRCAHGTFMHFIDSDAILHVFANRFAVQHRPKLRDVFDWLHNSAILSHVVGVQTC